MNALTHTWLKEITFGLIVALFNTLQAQIATVPFEFLDDKLVTVQVQVNENPKSLTFVLDTGATADLLDKNTAKELGITSSFKQEATGASGKEVYELAFGQKIKLAENIEIENSNMVLMDLSGLNSYSDDKFDGIIGASLFRKYITVIDFENHQLILYDQIDEINLEGYTPLPFKFDNFIPIPQFDMHFTLNNGEILEGKVLYDLGAGLLFLFNTPFAKEHQIVEKSGKSTKSVVAGGLTGAEVPEEKILLKSIKINNYTFNAVPVMVPEAEGGVSSFKGYAGILGADIIKRFTTVLDYEKKIIYLKPNAFFDDPFRIPLSGIAPYNKKEAAGVFIYSVVKTSPAYEKGLRAGDLIMSIDGELINDLEQCRKLLRQKGKKIKIKAISEDGTKKNVSIRLEPLL